MFEKWFFLGKVLGCVYDFLLAVGKIWLKPGKNGVFNFFSGSWLLHNLDLLHTDKHFMCK